MVLNKKNYIVLLIALQFLIGCKNKQTSYQCGQVSVRVMNSWVEHRLHDIKSKLDNPDRKADGLMNLISNLESINNQFVILAGGFKSGKNLEMVDPCRKGNQISTQVKNYELGRTYNEFVNQLELSGLVDDGKAANMRFIIKSYFCQESCVFSNKNLNQMPIGLLLLENYTLQFTLLELVNL